MIPWRYQGVFQVTESEAIHTPPINQSS
jgi:hypothetical protein